MRGGVFYIVLMAAVGIVNILGSFVGTENILPSDDHKADNVEFLERKARVECKIQDPRMRGYVTCCLQQRDRRNDRPKGFFSSSIGLFFLQNRQWNP